MADAATLAVRVKVDGANESERRLKGVAASVQRNSQNIKRAGMALTAFGAAMSAVSFLAVKMASDFDKGMREVNTLLNLSSGQFDTLQRDVRDLALDIGVTANDIVPSLYQAISAGVPKENVFEFLSVAAKAAIGGVTDTETAVDGLTSVINAYGKNANEAGEVADQMFTAVRLGKLNFEELSKSLFNVVPIAAATGIEFETVAAGMAALTAQGVPASVASTQLRAAIQALSAPTVRQSKMMKELNLDFGNGRLAQIGLIDAFREAIGATGGNMEQLRKLIGSVEGLQAVLALGGEQSHKFEAALLGMAEAGGASQKSFEEMEKSTSRQMAKLKATIAELSLTIGDVLLPVITPLIDKAAVMAQRIAEWAKENPALTKGIVAVTAIVGGLALVLGPLLIILPGIISLLPVLGVAFAVLTGPIGLVVAAVAALVAVWATDFMGLRGPLTSIAKFILNIVLFPIRQAIDIVKLGIMLLKGDWSGAWDQIKIIVQRAVNTILGVINTLLEGLAIGIEAIKTLLDAIPGGNPFGEMLEGAITKLKDGIPLWDETTEKVEDLTAASKDLKEPIERVTSAIGFQHDMLGDMPKLIQEVRLQMDEKFYEDLHGWEATTKAIDEATAALLQNHAVASAMVTGGSSGYDPKRMADVSGTGSAGGFGLGAMTGAAGFPQFSAKDMEELKEVIGTAAALQWAQDVRTGAESEPFLIEAGGKHNIHGLAHGGIVTKPTMAMIGEAGPEAVIPLSGGRGGAGNINVNINGPVYGLHDLEEQIVEAISRRARAGGFEGIISG